MRLAWYGLFLVYSNFIEFDDGTIYRKPLYLMVKTHGFPVKIFPSTNPLKIGCLIGNVTKFEGFLGMMLWRMQPWLLGFCHCSPHRAVLRFRPLNAAAVGMPSICGSRIVLAANLARQEGSLCVNTDLISLEIYDVHDVDCWVYCTFTSPCLRRDLTTYFLDMSFAAWPILLSFGVFLLPNFLPG